MIDFVGRALERSLNLYLEACVPALSSQAAEEKWIPLREAVEATPYSQEYLSLLARIGRLEATRRGRVWFTTRQTVKTNRMSLR
jgi:hypothetical protein